MAATSRRSSGPDRTSPPPVRVEPANEWAWCGERRLELTPKAFAVLRHLLEHRQRLVTKDELLTAVWADAVVSEAALTSCIRDLRRALADSSRTPSYIETVHRRGFRFIGPVASQDASAPMWSGDASGAPDREAQRLVGRDDHLARLRALCEAAHAGRRRLVFVTGEAGIGKTALIEAFLAGIDGERIRVGRGQCVEHYGAGEAYLPVLDALGRLGREPGGDAVVRILRRYAPTWLAQLPALLADDELEAVHRRAQGSTRERMLRELVEALEALAHESALVLLLEDLHWSDSATIDLLAMLARRGEAARLLVIGTYRPAELSTRAHPLEPLTRELRLHGQCDELPLPFLDAAAVGAYLDGHLPHASLPARLVELLHRNSSGNPLFLANLVDHLITVGHVRAVDDRWELSVPVDEVASDVPETLAQMVGTQVERLTPLEQAVLVVASVAGGELVAALASVDGIDADDADRCCAALARRGRFLRDLGPAEWPDGTVTGRYGFIHALYQNVLYARVEIGRRVGLHARIGARLERAYGARAAEIAGELATHFEAGRDFERAVRYRRHAADNALRHHGHREAAGHATRALELLAAFPESPERLRQELAIRTALGAALVPQGSAVPEVVRTYARARDLCAQVGVAPELFPALLGLSGYYVSRAELQVARDVADRFLALAEETDDAAIRLGAHNAAGTVAFYAGEFPDAVAHLERGLALYDPARHGPNRWPAFWGGHDPGVSCATHAAWALWALGHPVRAAARMRDGLAWARATAYPYTLANAYSIAAVFHACCRHDVDEVRAATDEAARLSAEYGFDQLLPLDAVHGGWLLVETGQADDGAARIRAGVTAYRDAGAGIGVPTFLGLLAAAEGRCARPHDGLAVVGDALAMSEASGSHYWDAELRRLEGTLHLASGRGRTAVRAATASFTTAVEIARRQQAKSLELRATTSLCALRARQGDVADARAMLAAIHDSFDDGVETADLIAAKSLLARLGGDTTKRSSS